MCIRDSLQPEFKDTDVSQVNGELQAVIAELDSTVWQGLLDSGVRYLTAHRLALSPYGQAARLVAKDGTTTYNTHFQRLKRMATTGLGRVAGPTMYAPNYPQFPTAQPAPLLVPGLSLIHIWLLRRWRASPLWPTWPYLRPVGRHYD